MTAHEEQGDIREYLFISHRPLALYGAGMLGHEYCRILTQLGIRIDVVGDGNPDRHGKTLGGNVIVSPEEIVAKYPNCNALLAATKPNLAPMRLRLVSLGMPDERIFEQNILIAFKFAVACRDFSINYYGDLYRLGSSLDDTISRAIFRDRYRNWVLGDRTENSDCEEWPTDIAYADVLLHKDGEREERMLRFQGAESGCDFVERFGAAGGVRNLAVEFDNNDALTPRLISLVRYFSPESRLYLRNGGESRTTRFYALTKAFINEP